MEKGIQREVVARIEPCDGAHNPVNNQPRGEEVEPLKGVETDEVVFLELAGGEHDDGGNPADGGYVAEDCGGAGGEAGKRVLKWRRRHMGRRDVR
jgi:hypothetical protein